MKCAKCGSETDAGANYVFYYGTQVGSGRFDRHTILEHMRTAGQESVFLCQRCPQRQVTRKALPWAALFSLAGLLALLLTRPLEPFLLALYLLLIATGPLFYWAVQTEWMKPQTRLPIGDRLAIELRKAAPTQLGHDHFLARRVQPAHVKPLPLARKSARFDIAPKGALHLQPGNSFAGAVGV